MKNWEKKTINLTKSFFYAEELFFKLSKNFVSLKSILPHTSSKLKISTKNTFFLFSELFLLMTMYLP